MATVPSLSNFTIPTPPSAIVSTDGERRPFESTSPSRSTETETAAVPPLRIKIRGERAEWLVACLASVFTHILVVLVLALWLTPRAQPVRGFHLTMESHDAPPSLFDVSKAEEISPRNLAEESLAGPPTTLPFETAATVEIPLPTLAAPLASGDGPKTIEVASLSGATIGPGAIPAGLSGAGRRDRRGAARERGATGPSEEAVERGLAWLAVHQRKDGSWRFDHRDGACDGTCENPGNHAATTASTALALLAFYGAAHTHVDGPYADVINKGLYYLGGRMLLTRNGGDLQEGSMYAQGIAAIALCEAAALTDDATLRGYGEKAIEFILYAQDRRGGGWRYLPGEPGDTTVTGWQLMALKSAQMSGIAVASPAFEGANRFLDSVQSEHGASYGYRDPLRRDSTSAVGLLCRLYLGWKPEHPGIVAGVARLDKTGPSKRDMYFNYYATQVMLHAGGPAWKRWHPKMRDFLVATQAKSGHAAGSWYFPDKHGDEGGRLLSTTLAIMTLEVYYRHQPLYRNAAATSGF